MTDGAPVPRRRYGLLLWMAGMLGVVVITATVLPQLARQATLPMPLWVTLWWLLLALGVLSTFGPAPGSVEGLIYTIIPPLGQILGLWEVLLQSFLFSVILFYWVMHPEKRWVAWTLGIAFSIVMILPLLGLLAREAK